MAAAFYTPLFFPFVNLIKIVQAKDNARPPKHIAAASLDLQGHLTTVFASLRAFLVAVFIVYILYDDYEYPAFGNGKTLQWVWIKPMIYRNLIGTAVIAGVWDGILYFSPLKRKLHKYKITKEYPSNKQILHDAFWSFFASFLAAIIEALMCYGWSNGYFTYTSKSLMDNPIYNLVWAMLIVHLRQPHFYFIHRMIHPWKFKYIPDVGKWLYKWVHSLHHKSYNPTAFSGTSMHPVESTLYYSAALFFIPFQVHPTIAIGCIVDCALAAWLGHGGFEWPGTGDFYHTLHHRHFDCNYGAQQVPLDKWFGSYIGCKEDLKKIWGKRAKQLVCNTINAWLKCTHNRHESV
eukprot:361757_1